MVYTSGSSVVLENGVHIYCFDDKNTVRTCDDKQDYFMRRAANIAFKSTSEAHKHGCVIVKDGDVISEGYNHKKIHLYHKCSIHAEIDALHKCRKKKQILENCEMYVVRIGPAFLGHPLKYSKPCPDCCKAIEKAKIKKVYYSTNDQYEEMLTKVMESKRQVSNSLEGKKA
jgi:deoxycytidylate deaminase